MACPSRALVGLDDTLPYTMSIEQTIGSEPVAVLLVEDDPGDQELARRALRVWERKSELRIASDGEEALDYLLHRGAYKNPDSAPRPDLVLLDLNMPKVDGSRVLAEMRGCPALSSIPVVVLTTSSARADIIRNYELGANSYIVKPSDVEEFAQALKSLESYWLGMVALPPNGESS